MDINRPAWMVLFVPIRETCRQCRRDLGSCIEGLLWTSNGLYPVPNFETSFARSRRDARSWGSAVLTWPVAARPHQILNIHLADPYRVRIDGGPANVTPEMSLVGPQTYRRAHVYLSGSVHVFNILFQPTGLNRLVGINMTSLVNQDPAASDVLGQSAITLGDAVRAAPDFRERVAAAERWVGNAAG